MHTNHPLRAAILAVSALFLISGCSSPSSSPQGSGFLPDYGSLKEAPAPGGGTRQVYVNPAFTPARYDAVWLDPVTYYPEPKPTEDVSMATLTEIRNAIDQSLRHKLGQQVRLADRAGPGVARIRIAITTVAAERRALHAYQYIPVALVLTGARAAMEGGLPRDATIAFETHVADSMTGELLYAAVRGGTGERVANPAQGEGGVELPSLQPLIDQWTTGAANEIRRYVKSK